MYKKRGKERLKDLALQRIDRLMEEAEKIYHIAPDLSHRYASLALKIAKRARIKIPIKYKLRICRKCGSYLRLGDTLRIRIRTKQSKHITITCLRCGYVRRIPLTKINAEKSPFRKLYSSK